MGKINKGIPSPYQMDPDDAVQKILRHLELLRMPILSHHVPKTCSRDCHIIERNHTIEAIKHFIDNGCNPE